MLLLQAAHRSSNPCSCSALLLITEAAPRKSRQAILARRLTLFSKMAKTGKRTGCVFSNTNSKTLLLPSISLSYLIVVKSGRIVRSRTSYLVVLHTFRTSELAARCATEHCHLSRLGALLKSRTLHSVASIRSCDAPPACLPHPGRNSRTCGGPSTQTGYSLSHFTPTGY